MIGFLVHAFALSLLYRDEWKFRKRVIRLISTYAQLGNKVLGIQIFTNHDAPRDKSFLIVGNHLSYTDILVLTVIRPSCFVTSQEIRETPVLGQICYVAGCVFVERRNKQNISNEIKEITEALKQGIDVSIFPEATSTNGEGILRFRKPLYTAAIDSKRPVLPMVINYISVDGKMIHKGNRDHVFWYGDMDFVSHLWNLAQYKEVKVEMTFLPPIPTVNETDPGELAKISQSAVESRFAPVVDIL